MMLCLDFSEGQIWAGILIGVSLSALAYFAYKLWAITKEQQ